MKLYNPNRERAESSHQYSKLTESRTSASEVAVRGLMIHSNGIGCLSNQRAGGERVILAYIPSLV